MKTGKKIVTARRVTLSLVLIAVLTSLAFDIGLGTPSAFGVGEFFLLCPLGGVESMLASKTFLPAAAISLVVVLMFTLIFGRAWCAWGCPAPPLRKFFKRDPKVDIAAEDAASDAARAEQKEYRAQQAASYKTHTSEHATQIEPERKRSSCASCSSSCSSSNTFTHDSLFSAPHTSEDSSSSTAQVRCKPSLKQTFFYFAKDKRIWMLAGVLILTFAVGVPLFCLICPIGLTFGTVSSLWHLIVDKQVTMSVIVFPLCLAIELVVYRKWCVNLCPIGGLLGIVGNFAKFFRPRIHTKSCLRYTSDATCNICAHVCPEQINLHTQNASLTLSNCTRCGECLKHCPTNSISIGIKQEEPLI